MSPGSPPDPTARLLSLASGYMPSRTFLSALDLGVFAQLAIRSQTASAISAVLEMDATATEILLDALTGMGVVTRQGRLYSLCEEVADSLDPKHPDYLVGTLAHLSRLWESWSDLTRTVKSGRREPSEWTEDMRVGLALAMKRQAKHAAPRIAAFVDGSNVRTMLDLGGGPGAYSIAFAERFPQMRAVLCDRDECALKLARSDILAAGLQSRIEVRKADFLVEEISGGYDLVFLSSVLSTCSEVQNRLLLKKVQRSLNPGGRVLIRDYMLDDGKACPAHASLFSVCMLVATAGGRVYSRAELKNWLREARFDKVHRVPMEPLSLMVGRKPGN